MFRAFRLRQTTYAKLSAEKKAKNERVPYDWCYVYNFDDPRCPLSLRFEPGVAGSSEMT